MKKILFIVFTVFLNVFIFSCTPTSIQEHFETEKATGGEDGEILPEEDPEEDSEKDINIG